MSQLAEPLRRGLPFAFGGYVAIALVLHLTMPAAWTWHIAYAALIGMLFTYPAHALVEGRFERLEITTSLAFAIAGLFGLLFAPLLLVAAIAAHGALDLAKYRGLGVRVPVWYLAGCAVFDFGYAAFLLSRLYG
ncbi:MAG: hypothetical protein AAFY38_14495 [Pseudomonadota bacterium]